MKCIKQLLLIPAVLQLCAAVFADEQEWSSASDGSVFITPSPEANERAGFAGSPGGELTPEEAGADMTPLTEGKIEAIKALPVATPDLPTGAEKPASLINKDTRSKVDPYDDPDSNSFPARSFVLVTFSGGRCSGWMIDGNTVATAGHCVHTGGSSGSWMNNVTVYPGYNGTQPPHAPYGSCMATNLFAPDGWTINRDWNYDYGAIKLDCRIGKTTGWIGMRTQKRPLREPAIINGYPGDKPTEQWMSADRVRAFTDYKLWYENDTTGGMSGSPIWNDHGGLAAPQAIGVHAYAAESPDVGNSGTRFTAERINNFKTWKAAP
jgi:glutamyl endopeptidase